MKKKKGKFADIYQKIPDERRPMADKIIENIAFMDETLDELQTIVRETGGVEMFEQGKQKFMRESPALKSYNNTIKQRNAAYAQLLSLIPKETGQAEEDDGFDGFVDGREEI